MARISSSSIESKPVLASRASSSRSTEIPTVVWLA